LKTPLEQPQTPPPHGPNQTTNNKPTATQKPLNHNNNTKDTRRMSISAGEIVKLLKSDKDALRELSAAIASEPELRLAVINAVFADVATKQDLQQLRQELR
jgi:hypothetical protein